ncbi:DrmE family protein [Pedobacter sp. ASV28]|uniref:DrmE family protein n=1 Tax=Pedobacter sp. ASV28 TaxID=2795123 RepID=UPI0018ED2F43|nr:DrmE family protein [Pedobacter sp. ASV28]
MQDKLSYSYVDQPEAYKAPSVMMDILELIVDFYSNNLSNKLCIVLPAKELIAQWISIPYVLSIIKNDFSKFENEIYEAYKSYKTGDKLILNNKAIVEWVGIKQNGATFKTKSEKESSGAEITIKFSDVIKLQTAPNNRNRLSPLKLVKSVLPSNVKTPIENLLGIHTHGNKEFIRSKVCLIGKYADFKKSTKNILINSFSLTEYAHLEKIKNDGTVDNNSAVLLSNNLSNLALYTIQNPVSAIIIDGFTVIQERGTDFSDIDVKNIPTILITDLSEIENFEFMGNYGFEFFNFTKENLNIDCHSNNSPFHAFNKKLKKYTIFNIIKEVCQNTELETIVKKIHSIEKDEFNNDLNALKVYLIQLTNIVSRICHIPVSSEISVLNQKVNNLETLFQRNKMWLGDSHKPIEESISLLKSVIEKFLIQPSEKCTKLQTLISQHNYDYIICPTADEVQALRNFLAENLYNTKVISLTDMNDNMLSSQPVKAIITGWAKSKNLNKIFSSFLFSELTLLFYQFENNYYNSLQRRNRKYSENVKSTITRDGIRSPEYSAESKGFEDLYSSDEGIETTSGSQFDILEFELKLDNVQYSRYKLTGNIADSVKAKRIDFENDSFIYASESHKLLVINDLIEGQKDNTRYYRKTAEALKTGDIIALINTDRDILAELVEKNTTHEDLTAVKKWTNLWKNLLKEYFVSIGNDFKKLIEDLREHDCKKHEITIKTWLQDENRIGPDDDSDLISIALLTNSDLLNDNIITVREAIRKMTGWRMKAADAIIKKIKSKIHEFADSSIVNNTIVIEDLGSITVLKITDISDKWENIDGRYINRLLQKDII